MGNNYGFNSILKAMYRLFQYLTGYICIWNMSVFQVPSFTPNVRKFLVHTIVKTTSLENVKGCFSSYSIVQIGRLKLLL